MHVKRMENAEKADSVESAAKAAEAEKREKKFGKYLRTDMAGEVYAALATEQGKKSESPFDGVVYSTKDDGRVKTETIEIRTPKAAEQFKKPVGTYVTLYCGEIWKSSEADFDHCSKVLCDTVLLLAKQLAPKIGSVLICGLGNRQISCDAVGPLTAGGVTVSRHLFTGGILEPCEEDVLLSAVTPGVLGQTGIEAVELVRGAVKHVSPDLVILVDALASRETDRLTRTLQLSTTGIFPGGGIGNKRAAIDQEALGVPVMTIGVPTVIDAATLIYDALSGAELPLKALTDDETAKLTEIFDRCSGMYVSPTDSDRIIREYARLISNALNNAFAAECYR